VVDDGGVTRVLVSFDIDGTMTFGSPPGPIAADVALTLIGQGCVVGVASDWPRSQQARLWEAHGEEVAFIGGKHHLPEVKERFGAERYVHVGDTEVDERYARIAGFEFVHVNDLDPPVTADQLFRLAFRTA
jgi:hypothetical protein